ncbi:MAG: DNA/RNA nuclease SfsA [Myxococcota bacterium]
MEISFESPALLGLLVRRYKRFLADVELCRQGQSTVVTAHVPNTGSMLGLCDPGNPVLLTPTTTPGRKLPYTLQAVRVGETWVGCNTHLPNRLVRAAMEQGAFPAVQSYGRIRAEVPYGVDNRSRIDLLLSEHAQGQPDLFVEVKNVTLRCGDNACFPDATTIRGQKHLRDLMDQVHQGHRAALVFIVQRTDCTAFAPAAHIDAAYAKLLSQAHKAGVALWCRMARVSPHGVALAGELPIEGVAR